MNYPLMALFAPTSPVFPLGQHVGKLDQKQKHNENYDTEPLAAIVVAAGRTPTKTPCTIITRPFRRSHDGEWQHRLWSCGLSTDVRL